MRGQTHGSTLASFGNVFLQCPRMEIWARCRPWTWRKLFMAHPTWRYPIDGFPADLSPIWPSLCISKELWTILSSRAPTHSACSLIFRGCETRRSPTARVSPWIGAEPQHHSTDRLSKKELLEVPVVWSSWVGGVVQEDAISNSRDSPTIQTWRNSGWGNLQVQAPNHV